MIDEMEIGGYLRLECGNGSMGGLHKKGIYLNTARNAFRYILKALNVKSIAIPYYTCPVVWQAAELENCEIIPYDLDKNFCPIGSISKNTYLLYTNYFGLFSEIAKKLAEQYENVIIDNAQAFYSKYVGKACFYSPRKFFGLPDGGIANCEQLPNLRLKRSKSYSLCEHLLIRHDESASFGYEKFHLNEEKLDRLPIEHMSKLTQALMMGINYKTVANRRKKNFDSLHESLRYTNLLTLSRNECEVPMVYPYMTKKSDLRDLLIKNKIYVAKYWMPDNRSACMQSDNARNLAETIIPLPIDQRYGKREMDRIVEIIHRFES